MWLGGQVEVLAAADVDAGKGVTKADDVRAADVVEPVFEHLLVAEVFQALVVTFGRVSELMENHWAGQLPAVGVLAVAERIGELVLGIEQVDEGLLGGPGIIGGGFRLGCIIGADLGLGLCFGGGGARLDELGQRLKQRVVWSSPTYKTTVFLPYPPLGRPSGSGMTSIATSASGK